MLNFISLCLMKSINKLVKSKWQLLKIAPPRLIFHIERLNVNKILISE